MADRTYLDWPFFDDAHRRAASDLRGWRDGELTLQDEADPSAACRALCRAAGAGPAG